MKSSNSNISINVKVIVMWNNERKCESSLLVVILINNINESNNIILMKEILIMKYLIINSNVKY